MIVRHEANDPTGSEHDVPRPGVRSETAGSVNTLAAALAQRDVGTYRLREARPYLGRLRILQAMDSCNAPEAIATVMK